MRICMVAALAACGGGGASQGELGEACYPNGTCNVGLSCFAGTCVAADAAVLLDAGIDAPIDAEPAACADDTAFEPNDSVGTAYVTPVDTQATMINLASLAVCPQTDKDHYRITLTTPNQAIELVASWTSGEPVVLSMLNAGGVSIVNGTPMGTNARRACAANLPAGTYYALVAAGAAKNNYSLSIKRLASCTI